MTASAKKDATGGEPVAWENPLIPHKKLRALYVAMLELRLLDEHVGKRRGRLGGGPKSLRGEEGCRVSTTFDLRRGDLTSEGPGGLATGSLRGAKLAEVLDRANATGKNKTAASVGPGQLPVVVSAIDRLQMAMGAAAALKLAKKGSLVVVYSHSDEVSLSAWKPLLRFAAAQVLPMIFVVLPAGSTKQSGQLSLAASKCGVPGIPVDAADPVALFRVAQESMLRVRAGGGPVLMECMRFQLPGSKSVPSDPIETMRESLLRRKIVDEAWLHGVETRFSARLMAFGVKG